jgi:hypothetical protein
MELVEAFCKAYEKNDQFALSIISTRIDAHEDREEIIERIKLELLRN